MIGIIDYGSGNVKAIQNIYKRLNIGSIVVTEANQINQVDRIVLPGVGAFDEAMGNLNQSGLREALDYSVLLEHKPVLGICVGMQIMATNSEEGNIEGLNWIPGRVKRFDENLIDSLPKIPHMGWNSIEVSKLNKLLHSIDCDIGFYFLHSFYFDCDNLTDVIAKSYYGTAFDCVVNSQNIYGTQFHPEKSHNNGISVFKNFADL